MKPTEIKLAESAKILIVEDDSDQRRLLVKIVKDAFGCEILEAKDGLEALTMMLQDNQVNLILLDLMIPFLSGQEFLAILRGRTEFDEVPVVVCTALTETNEIKGKISNQIQGYLVKPINRVKLLEKILDVIEPIRYRVDYQS